MNIKDKIKQYGDKENSKAMKAYMKDNFEFLGIKAPLRKELQKEFFKQLDKDMPIDRGFVNDLWNEEYREFQYLAIDYLVKEKKKLQKEDIDFIRSLIIRKAWWDSVDLIASNLVSVICRYYPELVDEYILSWSKDENMWLRRTSIIYQLKYKENTNIIVLEKVIKENLDDTEFFIEKAIGWALRQYSKVDKEWVSDFLANNNLSKLSKKEASKYLN